MQNCFLQKQKYIIFSFMSVKFTKYWSVSKELLVKKEKIMTFSPDKLLVTYQDFYEFINFFYSF